MHGDHPDDPDFFDQLIADSTPDEQDCEAEDRRSLTPPPFIPALRRTLRDFASTLDVTKDDMLRYRTGETRYLSVFAKQAIAAAAAGLRYPVHDEDHDLYRRALSDIERYADNFFDDAQDEVVALRRIVEKAQASLHLIDTFGLQLPQRWSNLPPAELARSINAYALTVFASPVVNG